VKLLFVVSKSGRRSHVVAVCADNLSVCVPQSSERPLIERKILILLLSIILCKLLCVELRQNV